MSTGRAALSLWLCVLGGCLDQSLYVTDPHIGTDEDGGSEEADDRSSGDGGSPRKDSGYARCMDCNLIGFGPFDPRGCTPGTWTEACFQCNCCNDARDCVRDWERERRYECERPSSGKPQFGSCIDLDKRPNAGPP